MTLNAKRTELLNQLDAIDTRARRARRRRHHGRQRSGTVRSRGSAFRRIFARDELRATVMAAVGIADAPVPHHQKPNLPAYEHALKPLKDRRI
jgi:hypothetical protein